MVNRGNVDKHRYGYSGGVKALSEDKWGHNTARERYGSPKFENGAPQPKNQSYPQFRTDQPADRSYNDTRNDWRRGFGKNDESAEGKPNFQHGYRGKR